MEVNIWLGLLISFSVVSIWKIIRLRFRSPKMPLKFSHWLKDNWADYPINIGIALIFFIFENDAIKAMNQLLAKFNVGWVIPNPDNKGFLFVLIPCIVLLVLYPILRRFLSKPIHSAVNSTVNPTNPNGPKT